MNPTKRIAYCVTFQKPTAELADGLNALGGNHIVQALAYSFEVGSTGNVHIQMWVRFTKRVSFRELIRLVNGDIPKDGTSPLWPINIEDDDDYDYLMDDGDQDFDYQQAVVL